MKKQGNEQPNYFGSTMGYTDVHSYLEMWEGIVKELNGELKIRQTAGNVLEIHNISIPHNKREIRISVSDSRPLKFEISFSSSQDFELILSWEEFFDRILKKFSKPEIEMGWKEFDNRYLVKSNRSDLAKHILTRDIQKALLKYNVCSLSYQTNQAKGTSEMISVIQRQVGDKEMILELVNMFKLLIDNMEAARIIK
jgi:hypothetical protein